MSDEPPAPRRPPAPVLWWERLPVGVQVAVVLPVSVVLLFLVHITLLNQPTGRGFGYGVFWGVVVTFVIVSATRTERARRDAPPERSPAAPDRPGRGRMRL